MSENKELESRILFLLKTDARGLLTRIRDRAPEYITIFSLKRTRDHFTSIFQSKFHTATFSDLSHCNESVISRADSFYQTVDDIKWYLFHTEDMPNTVDDRMHHFIRELTDNFELLNEAICNQLCIEIKTSDVFEDSITEPLTIAQSFGENMPVFNLEDHDEIEEEMNEGNDLG